MKILIQIVLTFMGTIALASSGTQASLEDQLKSLDMPNQAPASISREKFYSIQDRYLPLTHKNEFSVGVAANLTGDSFLVTRQMELGYRFHFNNSWSLGLSHAFVSNQFTSAATQLVDSDGIIPDLPYAKTRTDLMATYNVFYGKFRLSQEQVFYFDQYISAGPGMIQLNTGASGAAVADIGFAFWLGKWGSTRLGLKDYYYNEPLRSGTTPSHNLHAHLDIGYLL